MRVGNGLWIPGSALFAGFFALVFAPYLGLVDLTGRLPSEDLSASTCFEAAAPTDPHEPRGRFRWVAEDKEWRVDVGLPQAALDHYKERARPGDPRDWAVLATDPGDDAVLLPLACALRDGAARAGRTDAVDVADFILDFVHQLGYVNDTVGTGFDEYAKFPLETLQDHAGDCEDSSILYAALLDALGLHVILLEFDEVTPGRGHIGVGVFPPGGPRPHDATFPVGDRRYAYAETTDGRWRLGELPTVLAGRPAAVLPVETRAVLRIAEWNHTWDAAGADAWVRLANDGSEAVGGLVVWAGWDAGANQAWRQWNTTEAPPLAPGEVRRFEFRVEPPPAGNRTRLWVAVWGENAPKVEAFSEFRQA